jgi:hypothetical protein
VDFVFGLLLIPVLPDLVLSVGWPLGRFILNVVVLMFTGGYY